MANDFLANLQKEGQVNWSNPSGEREEEKATPPESPAEKQPEDKPASPAAEPKEGEPEAKKEGDEIVFASAFHKHPRWLQAQEKIKDLEERWEKVAPLLERLGKPAEKREETPEIPAWFIDLFGDNREAWKKYQAQNAADRKALREEILTEVREESRKQAQESQKWLDWVDSEFESLSTDADLLPRVKAIGFSLSDKEQLKAFRNELTKTAIDYQPSDKDGNIDLRKAFEILELKKLQKLSERKPAPNDKRKEIASQTMQKDKAEGEKRNFKTSHDLAGKSFRDLIPDLEE